MELQEKLERIAREMPGTFGVAIKHLETGEEASLFGDELFQLASVFKIPILATLFRDVEEGRLSLGERVKLQADERVPGSGVLQELDPGAEVTIKDLAMLMIIVSDNYGTDQVLKHVGIERVNRFMNELGLVKTNIQHDCWRLLTICTGLDLPAPTAEGYEEYMRREDADQFDEAHSILEPRPENNVSTPQEINRLLEMIAKKQLISEAACDGMLNILKRQQFTSRIPNLLPGQARAAHKTGTIGSCVNDAGIVYMPQGKGAFAITVLSRDNESTNQGAQTIARLSRAAYDHFMES
ncbi:serine hydrolase [Brevibacillus fluminis]|uniref:Serine hydrolase n=1 Tax=Brevibacillus fluminis TaxID=511487 RepID=A0A3M8DI39_9BACL|nr:serine hydrolase [Brevibacillus fluminis]RNB87035.1 serine hydrolase [Brevibacillus fluminis]